jgi:hypothetical protein
MLAHPVHTQHRLQRTSHRIISTAMFMVLLSAHRASVAPRSRLTCSPNSATSLAAAHALAIHLEDLSLFFSKAWHSSACLPSLPTIAPASIFGVIPKYVVSQIKCWMLNNAKRMIEGMWMYEGNTARGKDLHRSTQPGHAQCLRASDPDHRLHSVNTATDKEGGSLHCGQLR